MLLELILAHSIGYDKPVNQVQAYCLAEAIYFEARDQPMHGQVAVAVTVMNRVKSKRFPNGVCSVIHQPSQFSYTFKDPNERRKALKPDNYADKKALRLSVQISMQALSGGFEGVHDSLHYYNPNKANPKWAKSFSNSFVIEDHRWVY